MEPACKVDVLSKENWPYKRADLTSRHPFYSDQGMSMINFPRAVNIRDLFQPLMGKKSWPNPLLLWFMWFETKYRRHLEIFAQLPPFSLSNLDQMLQNWPYKRAFLTLKHAFSLTICPFGSGPAKKWPYKRVDLTSVDHTSGLDCINEEFSAWHFVTFARVLSCSARFRLSQNN